MDESKRNLNSCCFEYFLSKREENQGLNKKYNHIERETLNIRRGVLSQIIILTYNIDLVENILCVTKLSCYEKNHIEIMKLLGTENF